MPLNTLRTGLAAVALIFALSAAAQGSQDQNTAGPVDLPAGPEALPPLAPIVSFMRGNSGWTVNFSFADPVTEIQWGLAKEGPFESTGFAQVYDPRTRREMANTFAEIGEKPAVIYVRYADTKGKWAGPFEVPFDPAAEVRRYHQSLLEMTAQAWIAFRHDVPNILYYTHVSGYRCGVREFRIGLDKPVPDQTVALAPCDLDKDVDTHIWIEPSVSFVSTQLVYQDGTVSKIKTFARAESGR